MSPPGSLEALRLAALDLVAASGDERAIYVATHSVLRLARPGAPAPDADLRWHRLDLGVDARGLGLIDAHPSVVDLIDDAFARAVAAHEGHRMLDLQFSWALELPRPGETYRSGPPGEVEAGRPSALLLGARAYLDAKGDEESAWLLQGASAHLEDAGSLLKISLDPPHPADTSSQKNVERAIVRLARTIKHVQVGEAPGWLGPLRPTRAPR